MRTATRRRRGSASVRPSTPAYFPGTPAILVRAEKLVANYNLKSDFTRPDMMAFFPGTVLATLQARLGDVRAALSVMAGVTQVLVTVAVLAALLILLRLFARGFALLRALGAPTRFVFAVAWGYAAALILAGTLIGLALGFVAAGRDRPYCVAAHRGDDRRHPRLARASFHRRVPEHHAGAVAAAGRRGDAPADPGRPARLRGRAAAALPDRFRHGPASAPAPAHSRPAARS